MAGQRNTPSDREKTRPPPTSGYRPVGHEPAAATAATAASAVPQVRARAVRAFVFALVSCTVLYVMLKFAWEAHRGFDFLGTPHGVGAGADDESCPCRTSSVPQYFQTSPQLWPGPTATGAAAFMAQTRTFDPSATYVPNEPLQTAIPVEGAGSEGQNIFHMMGCVVLFLVAFDEKPND